MRPTCLPLFSAHLSLVHYRFSSSHSLALLVFVTYLVGESAIFTQTILIQLRFFLYQLTILFRLYPWYILCSSKRALSDLFDCYLVRETPATPLPGLRLHAPRFVLTRPSKHRLRFCTYTIDLCQPPFCLSHSSRFYYNVFPNQHKEAE